jgi:hypothetical protein
MSNLFNELSPDLTPKTRVEFLIGYNDGDIDTEYLGCVGRILPRESHNAPDIVEVLLEPEQCYTANGYGIINETMTDESLGHWERDCSVRKTSIGWIACCLEGEYEVCHE